MARHTLRNVAFLGGATALLAVAYEAMAKGSPIAVVDKNASLGVGNNTQSGAVVINGQNATDLGNFPVVWDNGTIKQNPSIGGTNVYHPQDVFVAGGSVYQWTGGTNFVYLHPAGT